MSSEQQEVWLPSDCFFTERKHRWVEENTEEGQSNFLITYKLNLKYLRQKVYDIGYDKIPS